jgi:hypothetical protein
MPAGVFCCRRQKVAETFFQEIFLKDGAIQGVSGHVIYKNII